MKLIKGVSVNSRGSEKEAERILESLDIDPSQGKFVHAMGVWFWNSTFDASDSRWRSLADWAAKNNAGFLVGTRIEYSEQEINTAEFLEILFDVDSKGDVGPGEGTKYDKKDACSYCNSGAVVVSPFYIKASALPKKRNVAKSHQEVLLLSGDLYVELRDRPGSHSWLVPVADSDSGRALPWAAILPRATLPRMEKATKGFFRYMKTGGQEWGPCPQCDQDNWSKTMKEPFQPVYSRSKVRATCRPFLFFDQEFPDAAATWERVCSGARPNGPNNMSTPLIFVNQEVYQIFRKHAGKYLRAIPAMLVD